MAVVVVTGSCGLVGSASAERFAAKGYDVVGIDNDMRRTFFGQDASTAWVRRHLEQAHPRYVHEALDIRDREAMERVFGQYGRSIALVVHTAAQPSHDWAARDPQTDFTINAGGTLTLLECVRRYSPDAVFIFTSTNKVYGDTPNRLPFAELATRWELDESHPSYGGIDEQMSIDASTHSIFGASKTAADLMTQEYGRYFGLKTGCFRGGCLTGPNHSGAELHGFLAYLLKCAANGIPYTVFGYKGKQVRDNIHSDDLIDAFEAFFASPRPGEVYNIGGGRGCNCSVLEAIALAEELVGRRLAREYVDEARRGDHIWYITDNGKFRGHYPDWRIRYTLPELMRDIVDRNMKRWGVTGTV
jgi:CDP-paratose 2-epimerase